MEKNAKIFVAGHRGLVGSAILKNLQEKGYQNFVLRTHKELDLCDQLAVTRFFDEEKPEYVFLSAAFVGGIIANSLYRADFIYRNLQIQNNVIYNSYRTGVKKLLFLGSTCIYPRDARQPMDENVLLTSPLEYTNEPYAIAKIAGLKMCESFNLQYGTNYIAVMPTNLYGPNDNFDLERSHVLPALIRKICLGRYLETGNWSAIRSDLNKRPVDSVNGESSEKDILAILNKYGVRKTEKGNVQVEIWGTGSPMREFLWSEEMADACVFLLENYSGEQHVNIGTGKEVTIKELAETVKEVVGYEGEIVWNKDMPDGTPRKLTNVDKLHGLGWTHKVELREGVQLAYDWFRENVQNARM